MPFLDVLREIFNDDLVCSVFDKLDTFNVDIINLPILLLIRYSRGCLSLLVDTQNLVRD